ncbi:hypothetical protein MMC11_005520 [Xylographa trunciseda]|nr:hypothetical protein [Xylographa trunciseda]
MSYTGEVVRRAFAQQALPLVSYGIPFSEVCQSHVQELFKASRVFIICSGSLARNTSSLEVLKEALGSKVVGVRLGMKPHTLFSEILEIVGRARAADADLIITLGGGSLIDGAKAVAFVNYISSLWSVSVTDCYKALANDVTTREELLDLPHLLCDRPNAKASKIPIISIPTTLSGGEYSNYAGCTDDVSGVKYQFCTPLKGPSLIILDAALTITTPIHTWLSTGVRAVDHCTEVLCSLQSDALADQAAARGLKRLIPGLLLTKANPSDTNVRFDCQLGVIDAMVPLNRKIFPGASHGIGHMLGPMGVGHGETSCILLPSVCKYNAMHGANVERQKYVTALLWTIPVVKEFLGVRGLVEAKADLGDVLDAVIRELGMPRSLKEVGVGRERFEELAVNSLSDPLLPTNPVPIDTKEQVLEILEMCA